MRYDYGLILETNMPTGALLFGWQAELDEAKFLALSQSGSKAHGMQKGLSSLYKLSDVRMVDEV
jgi:hypothetical protein